MSIVLKETKKIYNSLDLEQLNLDNSSDKVALLNHNNDVVNRIEIFVKSDDYKNNNQEFYDAADDCRTEPY